MIRIYKTLKHCALPSNIPGSYFAELRAPSVVSVGNGSIAKINLGFTMEIPQGCVVYVTSHPELVQSCGIIVVGTPIVYDHSCSCDVVLPIIGLTPARRKLISEGTALALMMVTHLLPMEYTVLDKELATKYQAPSSRGVCGG